MIAQQLFGMRPVPRRLLVTLVVCGVLVPLLHIEAALAQSEPAAPETVSEDIEGLPSEEPGAERAERAEGKGKSAAEEVDEEATASAEAQSDADADAEADADAGADADADADGAEEAEDSENGSDEAESAEDEALDAPGDGEIRSEAIEAPMPFTMLGARLPEGMRAWVRTAAEDGDWTEWVEFEVASEEGDGPDPDTAEAREAGDEWLRATEAVWVGEADRLQVRVEGGDPEDVSVRLIDSMGLGRTIRERLWDNVRGAFRAVTSTAQAAGQPSIVSRKQWGADESIRKGSPSYAKAGVKATVVHHTAGSNSYSREQAPGIVRGIYDWHVRGNGWNDIGYNMLVDKYGTLYEGRYGGIDRPVIGAHAAGWNSGTFGISVMGNFDHTSIPSAALSATSKAIGWKAATHGFDPTGKTTLNSKTIPTIVGHRDVGSTSCPGKHFYPKLGDVRTAAAAEARAQGAAASAIPLSGDWNGDGVNRPGWFHDGRFYLRRPDGSSQSFSYGRQSDLPVVGDWDGDGVDTVGVVRDGRWYLRNEHKGGTADLDFKYGRVLDGDYPLAGDWNGNGRDTVGIVRGGEWHLRNRNSGGSADLVYTYGRVTQGDVPVTGDWNGNGVDTPGIVRGTEWHLRNVHKGGSADSQFYYGGSGDRPVVGDWNLSRHDTPAMARGTTWYLRNHNSGGSANVEMEFAPK